MGLPWNWVVGFFLTINFVLASVSAADVEIKFKKIEIELKHRSIKKNIKVELAETAGQLARGLMFRTKLNPNEGMLFVFPDELIREFWMKNTLINLDIGYFNKNKVLIDIQQMKAVTSILQKDIPTYPSKGPAMYALEMSEGWFKKNKLAEGTSLNIKARP